jgi:hypothetical protein
MSIPQNDKIFPNPQHIPVLKAESVNVDQLNDAVPGVTIKEEVTKQKALYTLTVRFGSVGPHRSGSFNVKVEQEQTLNCNVPFKTYKPSRHERCKRNGHCLQGRTMDTHIVQ